MFVRRTASTLFFLNLDNRHAWEGCRYFRRANRRAALHLFSLGYGPDRLRYTPQHGYNCFNQVPAEQLFWLHWMNIFTTKAQRHEAVPATAARPRILKNPWPAGLRTSCPPVAAAPPPFPPLPPVHISKIEYLFRAALCLCALVVKPVTAAIPLFPPLSPVNKFVELMEP